jgi:hypothetical protein
MQILMTILLVLQDGTKGGINPPPPSPPPPPPGLPIDSYWAVLFFLALLLGFFAKKMSKSLSH